MSCWNALAGQISPIPTCMPSGAIWNWNGDDEAAAAFRRMEAILGHDPGKGDDDEIRGYLADAATLGQDAVAELAAHTQDKARERPIHASEFDRERPSNRVRGTHQGRRADRLQRRYPRLGVRARRGALASAMAQDRATFREPERSADQQRQIV